MSVDMFWWFAGALWAGTVVVMLLLLAGADWRSRRDPTTDPVDEIVAIGLENEPYTAASLEDAIAVARLIVEISRETERYRHGQEITEGALREQP